MSRPIPHPRDRGLTGTATTTMLVGALVVALAVAGCGGGGGSDDGPGSAAPPASDDTGDEPSSTDGGSSTGSTADTAPTTTQPVPEPSVVLRVAALRVESPFGTTVVDEPTQQALVAVAQRYVDTAMVAPLWTGQPATGLEALFTPAALARLAGPDIDAVVDGGLPRASGGVTAEIADVDVTVLLGAGDAPFLAVTKLDVGLRGVTDLGPVTVHRRGSLVLVPASDGWWIDGYELAVDRYGPGIDAANAQASTTPTTPSTAAPGGGS